MFVFNRPNKQDQSDCERRGRLGPSLSVAEINGACLYLVEGRCSGSATPLTYGTDTSPSPYTCVQAQPPHRYPATDSEIILDLEPGVNPCFSTWFRPSTYDIVAFSVVDGYFHVCVTIATFCIEGLPLARLPLKNYKRSIYIRYIYIFNIFTKKKKKCLLYL